MPFTFVALGTVSGSGHTAASDAKWYELDLTTVPAWYGYIQPSGTVDTSNPPWYVTPGLGVVMFGYSIAILADYLVRRPYTLYACPQHANRITWQLGAGVAGTLYEATWT